MTELAFSCLWVGTSLCLLAVARRAWTHPQFGWPERRLTGHFIIWDVNSPTLTSLVPNYETDWDGILDFFGTWLVVLVLLGFCFFLGVTIFRWNLATSVIFTPAWVLRGTQI